MHAGVLNGSSVSRRALVAAALSVVLAATSLPAAQALGELVRVVVTSTSAEDAARLTEGAGGTVDRVLPIVDGVSARVPAARIEPLSRLATVAADRAFTPTASSYADGPVSVVRHEVGAEALAADGIDGSGVTVALIDTGVAEVPDLAGRVLATANVTGEDGHEDSYGHGTFQAGLIAGSGAASGGRYRGIAPGADLLSVKVAGADGSTSLSQVLTAAQVVLDAAERLDVGVLLLALDSQSPLPPALDPLSRALRRLWRAGVVVVVPAGNEGPGAGTIGSPGEDPLFITAGSVDDRGTSAVDDDVPAESSSRGPTRWGHPKPEVAAPGEHLVSLRAPGSTVDDEHASARVGDDYFKGSGTSMSAAVTAGAVALVRDAHPSLSPDEIKALLMGSATPIEAGDLASTGAGIIDAAAAVRSAEVPDLSDDDDEDEDEDDRDRGRGRWRRQGWQRDGAGIWRLEPGSWLTWSARQWRARQWRDDDWSARQWRDEHWSARQWRARQWRIWDWAARQWRARQWRDEDWTARQWRARQWRVDDWAARQWRDRDWSARQWRDEHWSARQWRSDDWSARQWRAEEWSARQWRARQWRTAGWG